MNKGAPNSNHFQLEQVGAGIYAAFASAGGYAVANAGIVDLGDQTIIFDTCLSAEAGRELQAAAVAKTGRMAKFVVNSHHHLDHIGGNSVFASQAAIVSSLGTHEKMKSASPQELEEYRNNAAARLEQLEQARKAETKAVKQQQLNAHIHYYRAVLAALPELTITPSNIYFDSKLIIEGSKRCVTLLCYGGGHSPSDTILHIPDARLIFTGDLLSVGFHPYLADGDPGELDRMLNLIIGLAPDLLVPGHGPIAMLDDVRMQRQYLTQLTELALRELVYGTTGVDEALRKAAALPIPPLFANWQYASFLHENLIFLYRRLLAAYAD
jgi:glyoxylase-like metal-dependent hydrolase (beta-lactamase superfamily II)